MPFGHGLVIPDPDVGALMTAVAQETALTVTPPRSGIEIDMVLNHAIVAKGTIYREGQLELPPHTASGSNK